VAARVDQVDWLLLELPLLFLEELDTLPEGLDVEFELGQIVLNLDSQSLL